MFMFITLQLFGDASGIAGRRLVVVPLLQVNALAFSLVELGNIPECWRVGWLFLQAVLPGIETPVWVQSDLWEAVIMDD